MRSIRTGKSQEKAALQYKARLFLLKYDRLIGHVNNQFAISTFPY